MADSLETTYHGAMAITHFQGTETTTVGDIPKVGETLPPFTLINPDFEEVSLQDYAGKKLVLNIFPSIDTGVCAASVRHFNEDAAALDDTVVLCISKDLPLALGRFCAAEGIKNVQTLSAFRSTFGEDYGVTLTGSPFKGLLARTVIVADAAGRIVYSTIVDEITNEPNYDEALAALK